MDRDRNRETQGNTHTHRERERERERERHTDRETVRQSTREKESQTDRQTERHRPSIKKAKIVSNKLHYNKSNTTIKVIKTVEKGKNKFLWYLRQKKSKQKQDIFYRTFSWENFELDTEMVTQTSKQLESI